MPCTRCGSSPTLRSARNSGRTGPEVSGSDCVWAAAPTEQNSRTTQVSKRAAEMGRGDITKCLDSTSAGACHLCDPAVYCRSGQARCFPRSNYLFVPRCLMALSFAKDIRPLFRDSPDVDTMKEFGLDLSSYDDVKAQAEGIHARLEDGSMPCDEAWPQKI